MEERGQRLDEIGTADDSCEFAILENRNALDAVFLQDVGELDKGVSSLRKSPDRT